MKNNVHTRRLDEIGIEDLEAFKVWQYTSMDTDTEFVLCPVKKLPVKSLSGRLAGTEVRLSNGTKVWALIGNIDLSNPRLTQHFLTLSIHRKGKWFTMARYHDHDVAKRGPKALAAFLHLPSNDVFPITYDLSGLAVGSSSALVGIIAVQPIEKLTRAEIISLAVP
jgi:hypothetical protein